MMVPVCRESKSCAVVAETIADVRDGIGGGFANNTVHVAAFDGGIIFVRVSKRGRIPCCI